MNRNCGLQVWTDLNFKGNSHPFIKEEISSNHEKEMFDLEYNNMLVKNFSNGLNTATEFNCLMTKEERRKIFLEAKNNNSANK